MRYFSPISSTAFFFIDTGQKGLRCDAMRCGTHRQQVEWSRDLFQGVFVDGPQDLALLSVDRDGFLEELSACDLTTRSA